MPIINIQIGQTGLVGVYPRIVYIQTNDTTADVMTAGYLTASFNAGYSFQQGDLAVVSTSTTPNGKQQVGTYEISTNAGVWSIVDGTSGGGGGGGATPAQVQQSVFNYGVNSGIDDAFIVDLTPTVTALTDGLLIEMDVVSGFKNDTAFPTLQVDGTAATPIVLTNGAPLLPQDINGNNNTALFIYNAVPNNFTLLNPNQSYVTPTNLLIGGFSLFFDVGAADAYVAAIFDGTLNVLSLGNIFSLIVANDNTGASTIDVNGAGPAPITLNDGSALIAGQLIAGQVYLLLGNSAGNGFILINPSVVSNNFVLTAFDNGTAGTGQTVTTTAQASATKLQMINWTSSVSGFDPAIDINFQTLTGNFVGNMNAGQYHGSSSTFFLSGTVTASTLIHDFKQFHTGTVDAASEIILDSYSAQVGSGSDLSNSYFAYWSLTASALVNPMIAVLALDIDATNLIDVPSVTPTYFQTAGTGSGSPGNTLYQSATKAIQINIGGTPYWLPLYSSNS